MLFRRQGPSSPTVFNYNPWTFLWSVERYFPLPNCTAPGIDYVSHATKRNRQKATANIGQGYEEACEEMCEGKPDDA